MATENDSQDLYALLPIPNAPVRFNLDDGKLADWLYLDMSLAHNLIIRGVNSLYKNALLVKPEDIGAYSGYALSCLQFVHSHHHGEEAVVFPRFQTKLDMGHNIEQHGAFQVPMHEFEEYMTQVNSGLAEYDGERTRKAIKAFGDPMVEHLRDEITTITPEKLSVFTNEELIATAKAHEEHIKGLGNFFTLFPFALTAHDRLDAPEWPPAPAPVKWFANNIAFWFNRSYWKFSPYTRSGEPQSYM
ncbi:hypothetical protein BDN70DRAFT_837458 [Pholiota conissans]|uniref:Hemerythrin-like domain-containing protein n=1 Tax=Pholiota conissans TaxID=109636 RepID=A0A9P5YXQ1_9AGAR|nr:hypothetical protein BDN70DRAFT_837458 [Pholiota conissans]